MTSNKKEAFFFFLKEAKHKGVSPTPAKQSQKTNNSNLKTAWLLTSLL
jgi:hypothetical protein